MGKVYYTLEVARDLGVCKKTLLTWEKKGLIPKARRNSVNSFRYWTEQDLVELKDKLGI